MATIKRRTQGVIRNEVTLGQLIGVGITLFIMVATSYVNLIIKVNNGEQRQNSTESTLTEIKLTQKDIQSTQNIILQKLGALEARADDAKEK